MMRLQPFSKASLMSETQGTDLSLTFCIIPIMLCWMKKDSICIVRFMQMQMMSIPSSFLLRRWRQGSLEISSRQFITTIRSFFGWIRHMPANTGGTGDAWRLTWDLTALHGTWKMHRVLLKVMRKSLFHRHRGCPVITRKKSMSMMSWSAG